LHAIHNGAAAELCNSPIKQGIRQAARGRAGNKGLSGISKVGQQIVNGLVNKHGAGTNNLTAII
jgi:hypothetical protein